MDETAVAVPQANVLPQAVEQALVQGNLQSLTSEQRVLLYRQTCESLGLNPLTVPFQYLLLNNKLVLYATRNCTDQLRHIHNVSLEIVSREVADDLYIVVTRAVMPNGRHDEKMAAVPISHLKGESKANALMKCETKSARRATLSLCGLSLLDETEVETIPTATVFHESAPPSSLPDGEDISQDPEEAHPTADQVNDLMAHVAAVEKDQAKVGAYIRGVLQVPGDWKLTKKFLRESLTMTQYREIWQYYEAQLKAHIETDILDVDPPGTTDVTYATPHDLNGLFGHAMQVSPEALTAAEALVAAHPDGMPLEALAAFRAQWPVEE